MAPEGRLRFPAVLLLAGVATVGCGRPTPGEPAAPPAWAIEVTPAALTVPEGSSEPHLTVSTQGAILSWIDGRAGTATLRFAERTAAGWSEPGMVLSGDDWFRSYADVPSVLRLSTGALVANWLPATDPFVEAYDLYIPGLLH